MGGIVDNLSELIGDTPLLRLSHLAPDGVELLAKCEFLNPGGSIKDRPIREMIAAAEARQELTPGTTLIEASSGNTGIALAMICAMKGYPCVVIMPEDMSIERRNLMRAYGAKIELTAKERGMGGSMARARQIAEEIQNRGGKVFMTRQFDNLDNAAAHEKTTANEILKQCDGKIDVLVAGVGTGGTLTGTARQMRRSLRGLRVVGVEPERARAFRGEPFRPHAIQGIGAGFIPSIVDHAVIDDVIAVADHDALERAQQLCRAGVLVGPSSGANLHVALQEAANAEPGSTIVTFLCDSGERYLS